MVYPCFYSNLATLIDRVITCQLVVLRVKVFTHSVIATVRSIFESIDVSVAKLLLVDLNDYVVFLMEDFCQLGPVDALVEN